MVQIVLNRDRNIFPEKKKAGDTVDIEYNLAQRWVNAGIAHYLNYIKDGEIPKIDLNCKLPFDEVKKCGSTSIIILTVNRLDLITNCINSIKKYTNNFELIIIGNNPTAEVKDYILNLKDVDAKVIINKENLGFPYACNQGIKLASNEWLCFLNDDTLVTPNWLYKLQKAFEIKADCGMSGPTNCYSNGKQCDWKLAANRFNMTEDEMLCYMYGLPEEYIPVMLYGFCMVTKREIIDKVGGFDHERYGFGSSEETDLQWRLEQLGYKSYWVKNAYVHHFGTQTYIKMNYDINEQCRKNRLVFEERKKINLPLKIDNNVKVPKPLIIGKNLTDIVDVIIVTLDRQQQTEKTLDSLFKNNENINVIIVDNGSKDLSYLNGYDVKIIKNSCNTGVVAAVNQGLDIVSSKYILIIHNDVVVEKKNWIKKAVEFLDNNFNVGVIGTSGWKGLKKDGTPDWPTLLSSITKYGHKFSQDFEEVIVTDGQCNLIRNIGIRLDPCYGLMHFYDIDLSLQYRQRGYKSYVMKANVEHFAEDRKLSTIENPGYTGIVKNDSLLYQENRTKFVEKWKAYLPIKTTKKSIIPIQYTTWNRLVYTKKTLTALLANDDDLDFEISIFDNNSTDGTREYLESVKDERIAKIFYSKENTGLVHPKNVFLDEHKDCEYWAQVDNDNLLPKGWLRKLKEVMDTYPLISVQCEHYVAATLAT